MNSEIKIWDAVPGAEWDDKRDLQKVTSWALDPTHSWPRLMPMEAWFWMKYMNNGFNYATEQLCQPNYKSMLRRVRKGADYMAMPRVPDENEIKQREAIFIERVLSYSANFPEWWEKSKEELMEQYGRLKAFDLESATNMELLDYFYDLCITADRMWKIHFFGLNTAANAWILLENLFKQLWGLTDASSEFQDLMSGYDNKMLQVDKRLWQFSRLAVVKGIADVIVNTEPKELLPNLEQSEAGKEWLNSFKEFLNEDGWRVIHGHVFHEPTWIEEPTEAIQRVKSFIQQGDVEFALENKRAKLVKKREETKASLLAKVPEERKDEFSKLLLAAQLAGPFQEEHAYYCENYCHSIIRRGLLGIGRRLVKAGTIGQSEDIFMLNYPEVEMVLSGPEAHDVRYIVDRRSKEWEEWHKIDAPPVLTSRNSVQEAWEKDLAALRQPIMEKIVSAPPPAMKPELKADLYGVPASSGIVEGTARVVMTAEQLADVRAGDILVAPYTVSSWTPIFALVSGAVTDGGGPLSHTAIISREYNMPAVVNTSEGTKKIKTGQKIRVDGNEGVVYILG